MYEYSTVNWWLCYIRTTATLKPTRDTWFVIRDTWYEIRDTRYVLLKIRSNEQLIMFITLLEPSIIMSFKSIFRYLMLCHTNCWKTRLVWLPIAVAHVSQKIFVRKTKSWSMLSPPCIYPVKINLHMAWLVFHLQPHQVISSLFFFFFSLLKLKLNVFVHTNFIQYNKFESLVV